MGLLGANNCRVDRQVLVDRAKGGSTACTIALAAGSDQGHGAVKRLQFGNPDTKGVSVMCHDTQGAIAGRGAVLYLDQRFHLLDRHPEIAGVPDQDQPFNILVWIGPVTALRSGGIGQQSDCLILPYRQH
jgi:hypothetical protein